MDGTNEQDYHLANQHEESAALHDYVAENVRPPVPGSLLTGCVIFTEWMAPNGQKFIARLMGPGMTRWTARGIVTEHFGS